MLSEVACWGLDAPLTLKELQCSISFLKTGKTPEFYKTHAETLAIGLLEVLSASFKASSLPPSMSRAIIVVVPKPSKDPKLCSLYRPISLLNVDVKILAKVLASLDAEKAFDSVGWEYLWLVLHKFGFRPNFISWLRLLYLAPSTRVRANGILSAPFPLHRDTRQGCPLYPALFALAIESLTVQGLFFPPLFVKVSLYTDDILLYLRDAQQSLEVALGIIDQFGSFSGIKVNWDK